MVSFTLNLGAVHLQEGRGQTNFSWRNHPLLCPDKIKPRHHVSLLSSYFPCCCLKLLINTLLSFCFSLSLSWRKPSQYERNKKNQTIHKDLSAKNGIKRKKKTLLCAHLLYGGVSLTGCSLCWRVLCLCQHKCRLQREVKVNGFPTDKISHFCLLVSFQFRHGVLLCLIVNNMLFFPPGVCYTSLKRS